MKNGNDKEAIDKLFNNDFILVLNPDTKEEIWTVQTKVAQYRVLVGTLYAI
jgi:hypothetical protein